MHALRLSPVPRTLLLGVTLALALAACKKEEPMPVGPRAVIAYQVRQDLADGGDAYAGEVRARIESPLGFRIGGKLVERKAEVGDVVKAGQVLARLDVTDPALAAQAARNQQAAAEADQELARAEAKRFTDLRSKNFVSQSALDAKLAALKAAEQRLAAARAQADVAGNQARYADLLADGAGVVSAVLAEPGQVVSAGQAVLRLAHSGEKEVVIAIGENRINSLTVGKPVNVTLWAEGSRAYKGKVREIAPQADPVTRTYAAKVTLIDADAEVRLGMTATVSLADSSAGVKVPATAIVQQQDKPAVWVLNKDGGASLRPVEIARYGEDGTVLKSGLNPGELVVAAGGYKLMPGEKLRIIETR